MGAEMYRLLLVSAMDDQLENDPSGEDDTEAGALMPEEEQTSTQENGDAFVSLSPRPDFVSDSARRSSPRGRRLTFFGRICDQR